MSAPEDDPPVTEGWVLVQGFVPDPGEPFTNSAYTRRNIKIEFLAGDRPGDPDVLAVSVFDPETDARMDVPAGLVPQTCAGLGRLLSLFDRPVTPGDV